MRAVGGVGAAVGVVVMMVMMLSPCHQGRRWRGVIVFVVVVVVVGVHQYDQ